MYVELKIRFLEIELTFCYDGTTVSSLYDRWDAGCERSRIPALEDNAILAYFPYFEKIKEDLIVHLSVYLSVHQSVSVSVFVCVSPNFSFSKGLLSYQGGL
jgi:hypothetical protein